MWTRWLSRKQSMAPGPYFDNDKLSLEGQHGWADDFTISLAEQGSMRSRWSVNEIGGRPYV